MIQDIYQRQPEPISEQAAREFDQLLAQLDGAPGVVDLTGQTARPSWQLLVHAAQTGRFALHGSAQADIEEFEPRQSIDVDEFGNRCGVYAASDGLWPFYFAIVDRSRVPSLINAAFTRIDPVTRAEGPAEYFFSVASDDAAPWRTGTVYLLPFEGFERQPELQTNEGLIRTRQLFNPTSVRPVAKVTVTPEEFPLLDQIRFHDPEQILARAKADPAGFPWH